MNRLSVAIPTYNRGAVLVETIRLLLALERPPDEILVVDQTALPDAEVATALERWNREGAIRWIRLPEPSIPHAMNEALRMASSPAVLFLDDDVIPDGRLVAEHLAALRPGISAVVGQVLQPGETPVHFDAERLHRGALRDLEFRFNHDETAPVENVMAGNLSVLREAAIAVGGFDENFSGAAYRFETDFARRLVAAGYRIDYAPAASIRHLKAPTGGVRAHGDHRSTASPAHSAGDYYFALHHLPSPLRYALRRLVRNVLTRHNLARPWLIAPKTAGEIRGALLARRLYREGRRLGTFDREPKAR